MCIQLYSENLKEINQLEELFRDGKAILQWNLKSSEWIQVVDVKVPWLGLIKKKMNEV